MQDYQIRFKRQTADGAEIEYGIVPGGCDVAFIKVGNGGDIAGYEGKYLKMAEALSERGFTVVCASTPIESNRQEDVDCEVLSELLRRFGDGATLSVLGNSRGGYLGAVVASRIPQTKRLVTVNTPLMMNYQKYMRHLASIPEVEKIFVYGECDPSFAYLPFLRSKALPCAKIVTVAGANHNFEGKLEEFIALCELI